MQHASLLHLLRDGTFGPLRIGAPRNSVTALLGTPTDTSVLRIPRSGPPAILKYGDVEFHFGSPSGQTLTLIHADAFTGPRGTIAFSAHIPLDTWVLRKNLTVAEFTASALASGIGLVPLAHPDPDLTVLGTPAGAQVGFYAHPPAGESPFLWVSLTESAA